MTKRLLLKQWKKVTHCTKTLYKAGVGSFKTLNKGNYFSWENSTDHVSHSLWPLVDTVQTQFVSDCLRPICGCFPHVYCKKTGMCMSQWDAFNYYYYYYYCFLLRTKLWDGSPPGHGGFGTITNDTHRDRDKGNALVSHVVCFWESRLV